MAAYLWLQRQFLNAFASRVSFPSRMYQGLNFGVLRRDVVHAVELSGSLARNAVGWYRFRTDIPQIACSTKNSSMFRSRVSGSAWALLHRAARAWACAGQEEVVDMREALRSHPGAVVHVHRSGNASVGTCGNGSASISLQDRHDRSSSSAFS